MSSSGAVAKQQPKEVAQPDAAGGVIEEKEQSAKASANVSTLSSATDPSDAGEC